MEIQEVVAVSACRTAIAKFMGGLKDVSARELAMTAGRHAIERAGIPAGEIDEICMGQVFPGMQGSLPARQVAMRIGLSHESSAVSVNQNCASGMRALEVAAHNIMLGKTRSALVVGTESMTNAPYMLPKGRMGYRMGSGQIEDQMLHDGLVDEMVPGHMGITAENIAEKYQITRRECDELALMSHLRAKAAIEKGLFKEEVVPVEIISRKKTRIFETDEHPILDASMESMAALPSAFKKDGVVTAANASGLNDGAAAMVLMSKKAALDMGLKPLMKLVNVCDMGVDPKVMGLGPAVCIPKCLQQAGLSFDAIDYWEINEAFAAQWLGVGRMMEKDFGMKLDMEKVNANGSGIALGHPVGCTGLRIVVSLYHEMKRRGATLGGASLCVGGGPAVSSLWTLDI
ncbi:acetyl-CoA C-acetyltransferase [Desulfobotulus alkaliphilus]|uniref:Acetyl-CoA C-acetyltransferase n=1 Tax=Desulfobotulus alkaliphilus TaxID=622671 RepID=A0A562RFG4_9BACT|nr:thiolase family protein [Desulfobotulus alkaliphilus]TWI67809.1 acetyl-CoA C-acetyltransferase [Desulfobotulus alkaliphilus]